ncbi:peptidoglycan-binding domain-containing protein [Agromyces soli]|uniref:Peptidoglycan-binding protein n=1 Tax=Agromyces soli TaxID=659012 RepID=A0ABY4ATB9_9MICO|nr:peptidoglycan-binding domain-containing protein [Agromyces soli]UOE26069.1 peptidoglycan-binding protein [Agromyces soli]
MKIRKALIGAVLAGATLLGGVAAAAPAQAAGRCVDYQYSQGGYSTCIGHIQAILRQYNQVTVVDNNFGPATATAVKSFQRNSGLTADGIVGANTWAKLCAFGKAATYPPYAAAARAAAAAAGC